jgi:hypothetical protein
MGAPLAEDELIELVVIRRWRLARPFLQVLADSVCAGAELLRPGPVVARHQLAMHLGEHGLEVFARGIVPG